MSVQTCPGCGSNKLSFKTLQSTWQENQPNQITRQGKTGGVAVALWVLALCTAFLSFLIPAARPWQASTAAQTVTRSGRRTEWLCNNCGRRGWLDA